MTYRKSARPRRAPGHAGIHRVRAAADASRNRAGGTGVFPRWTAGTSSTRSVKRSPPPGSRWRRHDGGGYQHADTDRRGVARADLQARGRFHRRPYTV